jgi:hypothetical protein
MIIPPELSNCIWFVVPGSGTVWHVSTGGLAECGTWLPIRWQGKRWVFNEESLTTDTPKRMCKRCARGIERDRKRDETTEEYLASRPTFGVVLGADNV